MIILLSPAKALDFDTPAQIKSASEPLFAQEAQELIAILREKSPQEIAALMSLSDKLAHLNVARYAAWSVHAGSHNAKQAILAFDGDVYTGLQAKTLTPADLDWAQHHFRILSGLYGVLRPLDWLQPYRLEMGTALSNPKGASLYRFWAGTIANYLNELVSQPESTGEQVFINLASQEYFKAVDEKSLRAPVLECAFEDYKDGKYKIIGIFAKKARGLMARYIIDKRLSHSEQLKDFNREGYAYDPAVSTARRLVFRRKMV